MWIFEANRDQLHVIVRFHQNLSEVRVIRNASHRHVVVSQNLLHLLKFLLRGVGCSGSRILLQELLHFRQPLRDNVDRAPPLRSLCGGTQSDHQVIEPKYGPTAIQADDSPRWIRCEWACRASDDEVVRFRKDEDKINPLKPCKVLHLCRWAFLLLHDVCDGSLKSNKRNLPQVAATSDIFRKILFRHRLHALTCDI